VVGRDLTILLFGIAAGAVLALIVQRAREQMQEENFQSLAEQVDKRLLSLEAAHQTA
jgi:hypothetical protein